MKTLYLITGPAGVGKSTVSNALANKLSKSALIEGDDVYHMVCGGYVSPWLKGNHMDIFWKNSISLIDNFLSNGYDVVFNYIINKEEFDFLKENFKDYDVNFTVLLTDEKELLKRDSLREKDCRMNERCLVLLNDFKKQHYDDNYIIDTTNLSVDEVVNKITKK